MAATKTCFLLFALLQTVWTLGDKDKVLLSDVKVLTLHQGSMTTSRRSGPVAQLNCVGGNAKGKFIPQVVQCYNRGSDGYDVQWECKTDMDNAYRFGKVQVSCEGYDYADDPYVLTGSCGLDYTLDLTKEGHQQESGHNYYGNSHHGNGHHGNSYPHNSYGKLKHSSGLGDLIMLAIIALVIYAIYKMFLAPSRHDEEGESAHRSDNHRGESNSPPPPGFRQEYMPGRGCSSEYSSHTTHTPGGHTGTATGGGGFWGGAATGGILGYLFGSRRNHGSYNQPYNSGLGTGWGSGWGSGSGWFSGGGRTHNSSSWSNSASSGSSGNSTGTRTASGFGGTSRR